MNLEDKNKKYPLFFIKDNGLLAYELPKNPYKYKGLKWHKNYKQIEDNFKPDAFFIDLLIDFSEESNVKIITPYYDLIINPEE